MPQAYRLVERGQLRSPPFNSLFEMLPIEHRWMISGWVVFPFNSLFEMQPQYVNPTHTSCWAFNSLFEMPVSTAGTWVFLVSTFNSLFEMLRGFEALPKLGCELCFQFSI